MPSLKHLLLFFIANLLISSAIYRDAMWGSSLLAPLDIGPAIFEHYRFMDPDASQVPKNHHIIDQFTYDLPLQATIHKAYRNGEIPWWDPYTYGGRPLLADAHINGTDPIRLICYYLLPFELAYNWNYLIRGFLTGLGMFLLLSHLGVSSLPAAMLSIAYQFAGWFTLLFGHPWVQGGFVYFPFVWLLWSRALGPSFAKSTALAGLACGMVFYAGNLQSHTYLPLFATAFVLGQISTTSKKLFFRSVIVCVISGVIGALLAFPVLANQLEFYFHSIRPVGELSTWYAKLGALPCALTSFYPWAGGTFRTFELTKRIGGEGTCFPLFFGALTSFLAVIGAVRCWVLAPAIRTACRIGISLVIIYLIIMTTPLSVIFYARSAGLAGLGLTVLAGIALQALLDKRIQIPKSWVRAFILFMLAVALGSSFLAWFVYPHYKPLIERKVAESSAESSYAGLPSIAAMRQFQMGSFSKEVSLLNPEAALTLFASLIFAFGFLHSSSNKERRTREWIILTAIAVGVIPVLMFHSRFKPKHPIELWQRMQAGGKAQQEAIALARGGLRLDESNQILSKMIFPNAMGALYRIHCVQGYSALQPPGVFRYPLDAAPLAPSWRSDLYISDSVISFRTLSEKTGPFSRFRLYDYGQLAGISIQSETFNSITLDLSEHDLSVPLIRTDTYYPGWRAHSNITMEKLDPCFAKLGNLLDCPDSTLTLRYEPSMAHYCKYTIGSGLIGFLVLMLSPAGFIRKNVPANLMHS